MGKRIAAVGLAAGLAFGTAACHSPEKTSAHPAGAQTTTGVPKDTEQSHIAPPTTESSERPSTALMAEISRKEKEFIEAARSGRTVAQLAINSCVVTVDPKTRIGNIIATPAVILAEDRNAKQKAQVFAGYSLFTNKFVFATWVAETNPDGGAGKLLPPSLYTDMIGPDPATLQSHEVLQSKTGVFSMEDSGTDAMNVIASSPLNPGETVDNLTRDPETHALCKIDMSTGNPSQSI